MQIGLIGLGRMGSNMAQRLLAHGHDVVVFDTSPAACNELRARNATVASSIAEFRSLLTPPRAAWIMVPHGAAVDSVIAELTRAFSPGDIIIDGGNSHFIESIRRYDELAKSNIQFLDVGVSGGVFGLERGYCLMVGGDEQAFAQVEPIFSALAPKEEQAPPTKSRTVHHSSAHNGYLYCGRRGAGHYVKMIHNAIEYGMMQSYAEGLDLLHNAQTSTLAPEQHYNFDIREICELWRRGSVVSSWLLDLMADALHKDPSLNNFSGHVPDSGEGRWAMIEAIKQGTSAPNLANSLFTRFRSQKESTFAERSLSALRKEFGGHQEGAKK